MKKIDFRNKASQSIQPREISLTTRTGSGISRKMAAILQLVTQTCHFV